MKKLLGVLFLVFSATASAYGYWGYPGYYGGSGLSIGTGYWGGGGRHWHGGNRWGGGGVAVDLTPLFYRYQQNRYGYDRYDRYDDRRPSRVNQIALLEGADVLSDSQRTINVNVTRTELSDGTRRQMALSEQIARDKDSLATLDMQESRGMAPQYVEGMRPDEYRVVVRQRIASAEKTLRQLMGKK
jgi:hypothetical protein